MELYCLVLFFDLQCFFLCYWTDNQAVDNLRGPSGRLLQYDPSTEEVSVLLRDLWFANSVTVDQNETYLLFTCTFSLRIGKYFLQGEKKGSVEYVVDGHPAPGYFDGVDCSWKGVKSDSAYCYSVCVSSIVTAAKIIFSLPHPFDAFLRGMLLMLPKTLIPEVKPYGGIVVLNPDESQSSSFVELLQDPYGKDIGHLTGVTVHNNSLYLGSLRNDYIGVFSLA